MANASVTAGFRCAPDMFAVAYIAKLTPSVHTTATCHNPTCAPVIAAAATEDVPIITIRYVPTASPMKRLRKSRIHPAAFA